MEKNGLKYRTTLKFNPIVYTQKLDNMKLQIWLLVNVSLLIKFSAQKICINTHKNVYVSKTVLPTAIHENQGFFLTKHKDAALKRFFRQIAS